VINPVFSDLNGGSNDNRTVLGERGKPARFVRIKDDPDNQWHGRLKRVPTATSYEMSNDQQQSIEDDVYRQITAILSYSFKKRRDSLFKGKKKNNYVSEEMAIRE